MEAIPPDNFLINEAGDVFRWDDSFMACIPLDEYRAISYNNTPVAFNEGRAELYKVLPDWYLDNDVFSSICH